MSLLTKVGFGVGRREVRDVYRGTRARADSPVHVAVVGGGLAGVAAACVLAERGVRVTLLEKDGQLGGRVSAWTEYLPDGTPYQMERGFHGFFRQYYNLRNLLRRVDPDLARLVPLTDYPILGPDGATESFEGLPRTPPLNLLTLLGRTQFVSLSDLRAIDQSRARAMLSYDSVHTYRQYDDMSARAYLDSLGFPARGRQMLFDVFSHSFFNPEEGLSAAEMLMMFHFYFLGNPEGLIFDVVDEPFSDAIWRPFERYLAARGVALRLHTAVQRLDRGAGGSKGGWTLTVDRGASVEADAVVLATAVPGLQSIFRASPDLTSDPNLAQAVEELGVTLPFAVWRLYVDRPAERKRHPFVGTAGFGLLDNISLYERFEGESRRWALRTGGSVVELHAYAIPGQESQSAIKAELKRALFSVYPELKEASISHETWLYRQDCPSFEPGSNTRRPRVHTPFGNLALAGDFVKLPFPTALMERAASSGMLAANHLLDRWDIRGETLYSVPTRGFMAAAASR